jgi:hypothetical protein
MARYIDDALCYLVEATLQISRNQYVSFSSFFRKPLYLTVEKELFPSTSLVEIHGHCIA